MRWRCADGLVDVVGEGGDAVLNLTPEFVEIVFVDGAVRIFKLGQIGEAVVAIFEPLVDAVGAVAERSSAVVAFRVDFGAEEEGGTARVFFFFIAKEKIAVINDQRCSMSPFQLRVLQSSIFRIQ